MGSVNQALYFNQAIKFEAVSNFKKMRAKRSAYRFI